MKKILTLVFGCVMAAIAWGQQAPFRVFETDKGCKVLARSNIYQPPFAWSGACEGGYASGVGIFSYQVISDVPERYHIKGVRVAGKESGAGWSITDSNIRFASGTDSMRLRVADSDLTKIVYTLKPGEESAARVAEIANGVMQEANTLGVRTLSADIFLSDVKRWQQNPTAFVRSISGGGSESQFKSSDDFRSAPRPFNNLKQAR